MGEEARPIYRYHEVLPKNRSTRPALSIGRRHL